MSVNPRPPLLRVLAEKRAAWLTIPAIAALAGLVLLGQSAVTSPPATAQAQPNEITAAAPPAAAPAAPATGDFSSQQRQSIEKIIKDYLVANPEIFLEVQTALETKLEQQQAERLKAAIAENAHDIYRDPTADVGGNPEGDITVVEFFDYNCGYCKRGLHDVVKLIESDPKVRVVFKELPILSKGSEEASRVAIAAGRQGKYWDMHKAMLEAKGVMNEANALQIATKLGLDIDKLKKDMASPEVQVEIEKSEALAKKMGVNGTPHFLVGNRAIPGAPEDLYEQLSKHVGELRKEGCAYC
ncbi:MAG TPA: DsbA family protein [Hyphomicrobium sp.]|nr:DsbA family protein [Hyphomicrobium sp.]